MNKKLKNMKGITLIALVITIIILLILAMVSIRLVMNGGIIDRANNATNKYKVEEEKEQISLAYQEYQMAKMQGEENPSLTVPGATVTGNETDGWTVKFDVTGNTYTLDGNGKTQEKQKPKPISDLKVGDFVNYEDANGEKHKCVILYDSSSNYGIQMITVDPIDSITLGDGTRETADKLINGEAIKILNEACNKNLNSDFISKVRLPLTDPVTGEETSFNYYYDYDTYEYVGRYEGNVGDNDVMSSLRIFLQRQDLVWLYG